MAAVRLLPVSGAASRQHLPHTAGPELRRREARLTVTVHETLAAAEARLMELEALEDENLDVLLINIARISQLRDANPNYYADKSRFSEFVESWLS